MFVTGLGSVIKKVKEYKAAQGGGGGAVTPKQKPIAPRIDPRGALPMNTMKNDRIAGLANSRMKLK